MRVLWCWKLLGIELLYVPTTTMIFSRRTFIIISLHDTLSNTLFNHSPSLTMPLMSLSMAYPITSMYWNKAPQWLGINSRYHTLSILVWMQPWHCVSEHKWFRTIPLRVHSANCKVTCFGMVQHMARCAQEQAPIILGWLCKITSPWEAPTPSLT